MLTFAQLFGTGTTVAADGTITIPGSVLTSGGVASVSTVTSAQALTVLLKNASSATAALTDESYPVEIDAQPFTSSFRAGTNKRLDTYTVNIYSTYVSSPLDPDSVV